jgi:fibronectin-binding autotransporter adhesin
VTNSSATAAILTEGADTTSTTFSGNLTNGGSSIGLTKTGSGTLTLSGTNTYNGATTVSAGTLQAGSTTAFSANSAYTVTSTLDLDGNNNSVGSLAGGGTVTNSSATAAILTEGADTTSATFSGNLTNGGSSIGLFKTGSGTLTLSGTNTYSGATTVSAGTLKAGSATAFSANSAYTVTSTLDLNGNNNSVGSLAGSGTVTNSSATAAILAEGADTTSTTFSGTLTNGGSSIGLTKTGSGTLTLTGANTYSGGTTINAGTLQLGGGGATGSITGNVVDQGALVFDRSAPLTFAGNVSGAGTLSQIGSGTITLGGTNTYSGVTTVSAGTLQAGSATAFSASSAFTVNSTLDLNGHSNSVGSLAGGGTVTNNSATAAILTEGADNTSTTFSGSLTNGGSTIGLTKTGTGTLTLGGANTYSGATTVSAGTLKAGLTTAFSANSAFTVGVSSTLDLNGHSNSVGSLAGGGTVTNSSATAAILTEGADNTSTTFSGSLSNGGSTIGLTKTGTGTLILTGANTYSGGTTISAGTLQIGNGGGSGSITGNVLDQGTLAFDLNGPLTFAGNVSGPGTLSQIGTGTTTLSGTNTYSGVTTVSAGTLQADSATAFSASSAFTVNATLDLNGFSSTVGSLAGSGTVTDSVVTPVILTTGGNNTSTTFSGTLTDGTGSLALIKNGSGTLTLIGANTYSGATTVSAGTLQAGSLTAFSANSAFTVNATLDLNGFSNTVGSLAGSGTVTDNSATPATLTAGGNNSSTTFSGTLTDGVATPAFVKAAPPLIGNLGFTKAGTGTLILTGTSTYTGATTVSAGTLRVDGVLGNTAMDVQDGAALTGKGLIAGNVTIENGGHLAPGPGAQTLGVGGLALNSGSILDYQLSTGGVVGGAGVNSLVNATGNLTLDGILNITDGGGFGLGSYRLINYTGTLTNNILGLGTLPGGFSSANVTVTTAVPHQVNLVVFPSGVPVQYWDGSNTVNDLTVHGGDGTWINVVTTNFTNLQGTANEAWQSGIAIFTAAKGLVTLGSNINYQGMIFSTDGYTVTGDVLGNFALTPTGMATITTDSDVTATISAPIVGAGGLIKTGPGTLILSGPNTYSGGTNISPGILEAAASGALGTGPVQLLNGTLMILAGVTVPNQITFVSGGLLSNAGTLNNSVLGGGATDIVQLFTGSKINGNLTLSGSTSSTLILDGSGTQLFSLAVTGTVSNNGFLVKQGSGTWTVDRALAAPLGTQVLAGTLAVGAALTSPQVMISTGAILQLNSGGIVGNLVDNGSVIFAGSDTVTRSGTISGQGNVIQSGPGTTILSGRNTYSGGTLVSLGTLLVNNAQALGTGNVTVNGGILGASGLQPINVFGNYTQNAGGTLQLNISGRAPGQFDVLNVAGSAVLNGTLRLLNLGYQPQNGDKLQLVSTGGAISGRFAHFQNPFTITDGFNTIDLVYARNSVTLEFLQTGSGGVISTTDFNSFALTPNEHAAGSLLNAVQQDPRAANLIAFLDKVPFADLPNTLHQISPDSLSAFYEISFSNANIQRLNLESRMDDLHSGSNGFSSNMKVNGATVNTDDRTGGDGKTSKAVVEPALQPGPGNRWGVWITGFGDFVSVDGDSNANGYNFTTGGVSLGIDYRLTDELVIGVMGEYSHTWTSLKPSGSNDVNSGRGGLYATWSRHGFYLNGAIYGGFNSYNSNRPGLQGSATGSTEGSELSTFISGGYDFHFGLLTVGPIAALQYTYSHIDGFSENGSLAPMQIQSGSANSLRSDIGFRLFYQWLLGKVIVEPSVKVAWEHEYLYSALPITAGFAGIPGPSATFTGPAEGHDSAIISAGVSVLWTPTLTTYLNYDGQLGRGNYSSNAVTGGVRISF